ncbi:Gfo/Idh/MocA family protein [Streptomyces cyaneofuscatus]|uniref:Gfo/Idh/MocA family protein n=1 Tax=Streptomyces cyaneofuscatus TaxID=66883 RepID=UPI003661AD2C
MAPVRIGILGCAGIARRRMLPAMAACAETEISVVASRDLLRARETAHPYGCRAVQGYESVLGDPAVDAVYVPVPAALHAHWAEAALRAGKHVLVEKPLATDPGRTAELTALAAQRSLALMENVMFVHHGQHTAVGELLADGAVGAVRAMRAEFTVPARPDDDIRHRPDLAGGALWDTGVYPLRAALHFLGPHLSVTGAALSNGPGRHVDTAGAALLRTPEGVTAQLSFGLDHGYRSLYELVGSHGRITLDHAFTPPAGHVPVVRLENGDGTRELTLPAHDQVAAAVRAFAAAARAGTVPDSPTIRRQAELLADIRQAAR